MLICRISTISFKLHFVKEGTFQGTNAQWHPYFWKIKLRDSTRICLGDSEPLELDMNSFSNSPKFVDEKAWINKK